MKSWPVQDAKARFSEFLDACLADWPQLVTRRGTEAAVLVPAAQWRQLDAAAKPSFKTLLLSDAARTELLTPTRGAARRRRVDLIRQGGRGVSLLDANVISEVRKVRPHGAVLACLNSTADSDLCLSAVTLGEI